MRAQDGRRCGWYEVRALMGRFGIERLSGDAKLVMTEALEGAGLTLVPPLSEVDRRETLVLAPAAADGAALEPVDPVPVDDFVNVRLAAPGERFERVALRDLATNRDDGSVLWFDVADSTHVSPSQLEERLAPYCAGQLDQSMVHDLLSPDPRPRIKSHGEDACVRCVSAFRVRALESDKGAPDTSLSKAGVVIFEPVEFLVGDGWLITSWHDVEIYRGAERIGESPPAPGTQIYAEVARRWREGDLRTAGDLAALVLKELALTFAPAYRQLYVWEEEWELDFYRRPERIDRDTLLEIRASAAILRDWLTPLNPPGMRQDMSKAWFPDITGTPESGAHAMALRTDERVDQALHELQEFSDRLRSAYDLLQLRERERERERDDRFQRNIAVWGAAILVPTLVAGVMGANTWVPGQWNEAHEPPQWYFGLLVGLVFLTGAIAWLVIKLIQERDRGES